MSSLSSRSDHKTSSSFESSRSQHITLARFEIDSRRFQIVEPRSSNLNIPDSASQSQYRLVRLQCNKLGKSKYTRLSERRIMHEKKTSHLGVEPSSHAYHIMTGVCSTDIPVRTYPALGAGNHPDH